MEERLGDLLHVGPEPPAEEAPCRQDITLCAVDRRKRRVMDGDPFATAVLQVGGRDWIPHEECRPLRDQNLAETMENP